MSTSNIDNNIKSNENLTNKAYDAEIVSYYDEYQVDYEIVWHLKSHMSMHYG